MTTPEQFYVAWVSVDGAGSSDQKFDTFGEARFKADRSQESSNDSISCNYRNPFGYRYRVVSTVRGTVYTADAKVERVS